MSPRRASRLPRVTHRAREALYGYLFVIIWVVGFALFTLAPLAQTFVYSMHHVIVEATGITMQPAGWKNYTRALFTDPTFVQLLIEYAVETLASVPIVLIFSMLIALFLNLKFRLRGVFRTIFFLPVVITSGPVIKELVAQGATTVPQIAQSTMLVEFVEQLPTYLQSPVRYLLTSFILILWFSGVQILIYLASLQKIDRSIYEAAAIDGASAWEAFWKITLPSLSTTNVVVAVYTIITLSHFSENKVVRYIYSQTYVIQGGIGYASAMSFLYFSVLALILLIVYLVLQSRARKVSA